MVFIEIIIIDGNREYSNIRDSGNSRDNRDNRNNRNRK